MARLTLALVALVAVQAAGAPVSVPDEAVEQHAASTPRELAETSSTTATSKGDTFSIWGAARRYFLSRERSKAKSSGGTVPATPPTMPKEFGLGYKHSARTHDTPCAHDQPSC